jgi:hypothetical protein
MIKKRIRVLLRRPALLYVSAWAAFVLLMILSCNKHTIEVPPVTTWEDTGPDSATLTLTVKTAQGKLISSQYVNLALSTDSLSKKILVRNPAYTNAAGKVTFSKLYPRVVFYDCKVLTSTDVFYGSGSLRLLAGGTRDTTLIVY